MAKKQRKTSGKAFGTAVAEVDGKPKRQKIVNVRLARIVTKLYKRVDTPVDRLPYTEDFDTLHHLYEGEVGKTDKAALWRLIVACRKAGHLGTLRRAKSKTMKRDD